MRDNEHTQRQSDYVVGVPQRALKLRDACTYIGGVSHVTMLRLIDRGVIKPSRKLGHLLIPVAELDRFIDAK